MKDNTSKYYEVISLNEIEINIPIENVVKNSDIEVEKIAQELGIKSKSTIYIYYPIIMIYIEIYDWLGKDKDSKKYLEYDYISVKED